MQAIARPGLSGVVLPKAEDPDEVSGLATRLPEPIVIPLIETARGLWRCREIAEAAGVERLAFGSIDFQLDLGTDVEEEELGYARFYLVLASRIAGVLPPIDGVTTTLDDSEQLAADVWRARRLGFGGKLCIHPRQVEAVNRGFSPTEAEVSWATEVIRATEATGKGVVRVNGEMIDRPVIERAKRLLDRTET